MSKVLVVDDDQGTLRLFEYILSRQGYEVLTVANGIDGLRIVQQEAPDLVVLDVMLPGLDGFEVCHRLRSAPDTAQTPVIMVSAKGQESDRQTGLKVGADEYLVKPVDRAELLAAVERLLAGKAVASQKQARMIIFVGARGGVGTSTVVASLSVLLAQKGYPPILVDICPSFGVVPALMGLKPEHTMCELLEAPGGKFSRDDLEVALSQHSSGVKVLSGAEALEGFGRVTSASIGLLLKELSTMADYVLLDAPASPNEIVGAAIRECQFAILVANPGHDLRTRIGSAADQLSKLGVDHDRLGVVVVDRSGIGLNADLSRSASVDGLPLMGMIPFDAEECADAEERGIPVAIAAPLSPVAIALRELADNLIRLAIPTPSGEITSERG